MKRLGAAIAALVCMAVLAGCSEVNTGPDQMALHYGGGVTESQSFKGCVDPSKHEFNGAGDTHYVYPVGQRTFTFTDDAVKDKDSGSISIVSSDLVEMTVNGTATFNFTSDCNLVRKFHEEIGAKYRAQTADQESDAWWTAILETYVKQSMDRAMDAAAKGISFRDLYANPDAKTQWEKAVGDLVPQFIESQAGDKYFSDFRLQLQVPQPPASIKAGFTDRQASVEQNEAQKARNEQIKTALDGLTAECDRLGKDACMQKYAIDSGKVQTVVVAPSGGAVNLGAR